MNRADITLLAKLLEEPPECTAKSLERLIAEQTLALDAKDITAGKLIEITIETGTGRDDDPFEHTKLLARPVGEYFAVHKNDNGWKVTHRPSGLAAIQGRKGSKIAAAIAMAIQRVEGIDWSKAEPLKGIDLKVSKYAGRLCRCLDLAELADCEKGGVDDD
jgi:hypothetical protein